jgi:hypothetical protein
MCRVFSGVKMYWSSKQIKNPYPYDFHHAGNIFLHNANQAMLKSTNGKKTIYLAADE